MRWLPQGLPGALDSCRQGGERVLGCWRGGSLDACVLTGDPSDTGTSDLGKGRASDGRAAFHRKDHVEYLTVADRGGDRVRGLSLGLFALGFVHFVPQDITLPSKPRLLMPPMHPTHPTSTPPPGRPHQAATNATLTITLPSKPRLLMPPLLSTHPTTTPPLAPRGPLARPLLTPP